MRRIMGGSQPGQIGWKTLSQNNPSQKRADREAQGTGHEFNSQYKKNKKKSNGISYRNNASPLDNVHEWGHSCQ
jgi:hypothetical protein